MTKQNGSTSTKAAKAGDSIQLSDGKCKKCGQVAVLGKEGLCVTCFIGEQGPKDAATFKAVSEPKVTKTTGKPRFTELEQIILAQIEHGHLFTRDIMLLSGVSPFVIGAAFSTLSEKGVIKVEKVDYMNRRDKMIVEVNL